ncbi:unnamed protein product [Allacma fusca]|uniref:Phosphoglycerate mutase n=1 Tax=Allacma fusca TaxID=39272 RepID=A0A8J2KTN9_9HEXA|nr:unnamed protein product [Allacma fusca]
MSLVYFVRHGESVGNHLLEGLSPDENILSENGHLQAHNLGIHLQNVTFTHVFASPYIRAISTAEHILSESKAVYSDDVIVVDPDIRERNLGIYEEKSTTELVKALMKTGDDYLDWAPEGAETRLDVERRLESFLKKIEMIVDSGLEEKTILVVTHCTLMVHLWHYLLQTMEKLQDEAQPRELEVVVAHGSDHLKSLQQDAFSSFANREKSLASRKSCMQQ